jgi:hypothetical protein
MVSINLGSDRLAPDAETVVPAFVFAHLGCDLQVTGEHDPILDDCVSWEPENLQQMKQLDRPDPPSSLPPQVTE